MGDRNGTGHTEQHAESRRELANGFGERQRGPPSDTHATASPNGVLQPRGITEIKVDDNLGTFNASCASSSPARIFEGALLKTCSMDSDAGLAGDTVHRGVDISPATPEF